MKDWTPLVTPAKKTLKILFIFFNVYFFTNIVAPLDFVGFRIGSDFTVHIHVIALRNGFGIDAAAKTQSHFGWI